MEKSEGTSTDALRFTELAWASATLVMQIQERMHDDFLLFLLGTVGYPGDMEGPLSFTHLCTENKRLVLFLFSFHGITIIMEVW